MNQPATKQLLEARAAAWRGQATPHPLVMHFFPNRAMRREHAAFSRQRARRMARRQARVARRRWLRQREEYGRLAKAMRAFERSER